MQPIIITVNFIIYYILYIHAWNLFAYCDLRTVSTNSTPHPISYINDIVMIEPINTFLQLNTKHLIPLALIVSDSTNFVDRKRCPTFQGLMPKPLIQDTLGIE
jgi:hypothetical protein